MTCYFNEYCFIKGPTHQAEVLQLCAQATAQAIAWHQQGEEQKTQAQMHQKQQQAEHKLQDSHIKSLENDIGAANMHKIYNNSIVQAQKKCKMDTTVDLTIEDIKHQHGRFHRNFRIKIQFTSILFIGRGNRKKIP
jgi:hypothetical protein